MTGTLSIEHEFCHLFLSFQKAVTAFGLYMSSYRTNELQDFLQSFICGSEREEVPNGATPRLLPWLPPVVIFSQFSSHNRRRSSEYEASTFTGSSEDICTSILCMYRQRCGDSNRFYMLHIPVIACRWVI